MVHTGHSCTPLLQRISAKLVHGYARPGQGGSEHQKAAATCMQRAERCLSWAWSCSGTGLVSKHSMGTRMLLIPQGKSMCTEANPYRSSAALLHSNPAQAGRSSHFCHRMAMLTHQLLIQLLPWCWGKRNQRDSWEEGTAGVTPHM